ncbi:reverse transcriptase [Plakobranchus ocellatus]|uniref:Reverse transcriptase n=1 Tax=Plakobranchus ocellatus TaxID=259542 RepID=A0AAV4DR37_9GAST|nr:reverse transcriptase [Plakobranchus ocellatus]
MESYLLCFEQFITTNGWPRANWAVHLSALLSAKALDTYSRMSDHESIDYDVVRRALLKRYNLTSKGFNVRFCSSQSEMGKRIGQFKIGLETYLERWLELSERVKSSVEDWRDLILCEQIINACGRELRTFLKERKPEGLLQIALRIECMRLGKANHLLVVILVLSRLSLSLIVLRYVPMIRAIVGSNWPRSHRARGVGRVNYPSQGHRSPSSQGYSGSGRSGTSCSPSRDRNLSSFNSRSVGKGQQFRPSSSGGSGVAAGCNDVTCYQCGGKGHAVASAVSLCHLFLFPFGLVSSVKASLSVDTVVDKELDPNRDSDLRFCETVSQSLPQSSWREGSVFKRWDKKNILHHRKNCEKKQIQSAE